MAHSNIVQVLKECPKNVESRIIVQRGGLPPKVKKPSRSSPRSLEESKANNNMSDTSFSSTNQPPGHYFFDGHSQNLDNRDAVDGMEPPLDLKHLQNLDPKPQRISKIVPKPQQGMQECL